MRGLFSLLYDTLNEAPYLIKGEYDFKTKVRVYIKYIAITFKLFIINRYILLNEENIFGLKIKAFDYGSIHFLYREIFLKGGYYFKSDVNDPVIIDCGANIGFAVIFFKWIYPNSTIYAFEPDKKAFNLLKNNILTNNLDKIHIFNLALWEKKQKLPFYVNNQKPESLSMSFEKNNLNQDRIVVSSSPLSKYILRKIDFLKMDIEGAESKVINELIKSKKINKVKQMVIEYHHKRNQNKSSLSTFLNNLEKANFEYQLDSRHISLCSRGDFQDIAIYAYKLENK